MIRWVACWGVILVGCGTSSGDDDGAGSSGASSGATSGATSAATVDGSGEGGSGDGGSGDGGSGVLGDCSSPGWTTVTMPWSQLSAQGTPAQGGFSVCIPPNWAVTSDVSNVIQIQRDGDPMHSLQLGGEVRLDHAGGIERIAQSVPCSGDDVEVDYVDIDGWAAGQLTYTFDVAPCGECPDPMPSQAYAVSTYVAADFMLVRIDGQTAVPPDAAIVDEMIAVGRTVTVTDLAAPDPATTTNDLMQLPTQQAAWCGQ